MHSESDPDSREVTRLLAQLASGDAVVAERLIDLVYAELRGIAARCMRRERPGHTLQATVLVHDAFLSLVKDPDVHWQNRAHFFAIAALAMRRVLIHYARKHRAAKRGGAAMPLRLDDAMGFVPERLDEVLILDECLRKLATIDPRQCRMVELRFFAGMTVEEISVVMGISTATVKREWSHAKAWLRREMSGRGSPREASVAC